MREIQTDYLVIGAGATGMAFVDALVSESDADVVLVDRRHRAGGHWLDAYPFVRLHQPSPCYGVSSTQLGENRIDEAGPNSGFYERAGAAEICAYYGRVLDEVLLPTGRVRFHGMTEYRGADGGDHHLQSHLTGETVRVTVRRRLVDATYIESVVPSRHTPKFEVGDGAQVVSPNALVDLDEAPSGYTIVGAGKTGMDTCGWLLEQGVDPDRIRWIKPREAWLFDRVFMQPLDLVGSYMQMQARWMEAAAQCQGGADMALRLEESGVFVRVDRDVDATMQRGATISMSEVDALRTIQNVVRQGYVRHVSGERVDMDGGTLASDPKQVYVDCTAEGVQIKALRPVFEPGRITMQYVTPGYACWSGATLGLVEALRDDDRERNRLCAPVCFSGEVADLDEWARVSMLGLIGRDAEPDLAAWTNESRLNPSKGVRDHIDEAQVLDALGSLGQHVGPALANLERLKGADTVATP
ncbi:MAG TPA: NAD(P)-binding protein [Nocardioidaceae bacterium]|nr:NAD(P)-binding protein [Nocardioidaceae bacterium]